jgi:hypothetical protein
MEAFFTAFAFVAGVPATIGLILTAVTIFLTSDWRLALTALLVQYTLVGLALTRYIRVEVAIVKILVGVLSVSILYLTARRIQEAKGDRASVAVGSRFWGLQVGWGAGPLGLPLRLLVVLLVALALIRLFNGSRLFPISPDVASVALWLGGMGVAGLVLSGDPLRVAPAVLTILSGFDLIYAGLHSGLAITGFSGALILLTALAFSYLAVVQELGIVRAVSGEEGAES